MVFLAVLGTRQKQEAVSNALPCFFPIKCFRAWGKPASFSPQRHPRPQCLGTIFGAAVTPGLDQTKYAPDKKSREEDEELTKQQSHRTAAA